jgi:small-conductance mechanosensitive channel
MAHGLLGNSWERWAASISIATGVLVLAYLVKGFLCSRLSKSAGRTSSRWDDVLLIAVQRTGFAFFLVLALHFGTLGLLLPERVELIKKYIFFFFLFYQIGLWLTSALHFLGHAYSRDALAKEPGKATMVSTLVVLGNVIVWIIMLLMLLSNYGVNISALVAGLGIGGVAVALALQNILGDLFASLSIVLDRPFAIGDAIDVNGLSGTVEHIGLKTTRIRSSTGEQLIFGNADLLKNAMRNYKRMDRRRVLFVFGLVYETPPEKLHRARELVKQAVETEKKCTFERCHLATFAPSSLDYELVYWVESSDYQHYINAHHQILVRILDSFSREGLEFAYPHQVHLEKYPQNAKQNAAT